ncbi:enoyl-CoA hydratase/isomerase family protein [Amycolatopsis sp. H20-H5]|uniref:enoyl-CoA hydratase/isomerase family protein n=1 Tax=Amycolatopsis sp. H20-H5 TaxID=3046309 RepID=UPI002DB7DFD0|nr:enoyl-CoA hydratase/isomerase family protein [Amycolatopsis sp. H20-H5]MEC3974133.1 enoyl-CoA hydratase/isomerase family protein [Amycolatopsis sp. H20-H5]
MTETIHVTAEGDLAVVRLDDGKANTLHLESCRELVRRLDEVAAAGPRAVVLTGTGGMFSAGVDLRRVHSGGAAYVAEFLPALSDALLAVFGFPRPVVAAVNGHAIAGGAVLAAACDQRVLNAAHGRVGITELLVGLPFPLAAMEILRCGFGADILPRLAYTGGTHEGAEALRLGLADELAEPDAVLGRAKELANQLALIPAEAFAHTKAQLHQPFHERIAEHRTGDDAAVERMWSSAESAASIKSYVDTVLG